MKPLLSGAGNTAGFPNTEKKRLRENARIEEISEIKQKVMVIAIDLSETDISNMADGEFKATIIRFQLGLKKRMEDLREAHTAETKELKKQK